MDIVCDKSKCTGCSLCSDICAHGAIEMKLDEDGFMAPVIDQSKCVNCTLCQKCCPVLHPDRLDSNSLKDLKVYEAWSLDDDVRQNSSSGGIFGQLAHNVLRDGGVVIGVAFDGKKAFHTVIDKVEDLHRVQDTKYVQSHAHGAYRATLQNLRAGKKVIFSGTPCQVAACKSYLLNKKYTGQLLTMEVVCHGVPTYLALNQSLSYIGASRVISFRDKTKGWGYHSQHMCYESQDGSLIYKNREDDVFYRMFFCEKLLRSSCYSCPFAYLPRVADITIGDSWGTSNSNREEQFKGLSLLLINNPTGEQWLKKYCDIKLRTTSWLDSLYINRNVYTPFPPAKMVERIRDIHTFMTEMDVEEYMSRTTLGFIEKMHPVKCWSRKIESLNIRLRRKFLQIKELSDLTYFKYHLLKISYKIDSLLNPKPSARYLDGKFINVLRNFYQAKK